MDKKINFIDIEKKVDELIESLPCRVDKPYPEGEIPVKNLRIANLLLDAYANGGNSELTAITQYMHHHFTIEKKDVANLELCIALVEMKHLELLADMIESLGGDPKFKRSNEFYWTGGYVNYGKTLCEKLNADIFAEQEAIFGLMALIRVIIEEKGPGSKEVVKVLKRILEDEEVHLKLFIQAHKKHCCHDDSTSD